MDDYLISTLLLSSVILVLAAYLLNCFDLALKTEDEPTVESLKDHHNRKSQFLYNNREVIKSAVMQFNAIVFVIVSYSVFYMVIAHPAIIHWAVALRVLISVIVSVVIYISFFVLLPTVSFSTVCRSTTGGLYYFAVSVMWLMYPFSKLILWVRNVSYSGQLNKMDKPISMEELSDAVEIVSRVNTIEEKRILSGMVRFANADVEDIMCHRTDIVAADFDSDFKEIKALFLESGFSRIPVYKGDIDHIEGIIHLKDILPHIEETVFDWHTIIHKPLFADGGKPINELLLLFQAKKEHMAIVVDEYGSTLGLVTLEDVLEEIVGEIDDEFDEEEEECTEQKDGTYIIEGKKHVSEFVDMLNLGDDTLEEMPDEIDTVAGLVVELLQDFPKIGSVVRFGEYSLTVMSMSRHRIDKIKVEKIGDTEN